MVHWTGHNTERELVKLTHPQNLNYRRVCTTGANSWQTLQKLQPVPLIHGQVCMYVSWIIVVVVEVEVLRVRFDSWWSYRGFSRQDLMFRNGFPLPSPGSISCFPPAWIIVRTLFVGGPCHTLIRAIHWNFNPWLHHNTDIRWKRTQFESNNKTNETQ